MFVKTVWKSDIRVNQIQGFHHTPTYYWISGIVLTSLLFKVYFTFNAQIMPFALFTILLKWNFSMDDHFIMKLMIVVPTYLIFTCCFLFYCSPVKSLSPECQEGFLLIGLLSHNFSCLTNAEHTTWSMWRGINWLFPLTYSMSPSRSFLDVLDSLYLFIMAPLNGCTCSCI